MTNLIKKCRAVVIKIKISVNQFIKSQNVKFFLTFCLFDVMIRNVKKILNQLDWSDIYGRRKIYSKGNGGNTGGTTNRGNEISSRI
ncbi:MAG: hypothetical protein IKZ58_06005 [Selenomonadaceae bacterium]|nr:hypothetical protein [Selenomonadaceae bacterium]